VTRKTGTGKYEQMLEMCKNMKPIPTAVAHPCEESALAGAIEAAERGIIVPILVGPRDKIAATAKSAGIDLSDYQIVDAPHSNASAAKAVELVRTAQAELLMKGSLHTDELMAAVVSREGGLRTARRISHVFVMDVPTYHKVLIVTDGAINIFPTLEDKADICQNAIDLAISLNIKKPKVAILAAVEAIYTRNDLDLLLSSPISAWRILVVRSSAMILSASFTAGQPPIDAHSSLAAHPHQWHHTPCRPCVVRNLEPQHHQQKYSRPAPLGDCTKPHRR